jgi:hypothetical protein
LDIEHEYVGCKFLRSDVSYFASEICSVYIVPPLSWMACSDDDLFEPFSSVAFLATGKCGPGRIRTCDLEVMSPLLCP